MKTKPEIKDQKMKTFVIVKCIGCGNKKKVYAGEVPEGQQPQCDKCYGIMIADSAGVEKND